MKVPGPSMPDSPALKLLSRVLGTTSVIYLLLAANAIFAPTLQCELFGACKQDEKLTVMDIQARSLLIMARGFCLWAISLPLSAAIRGKDLETCAAMTLAVPMTLLVRVVDLVLREIPSAKEREMDTKMRYFLLVLAVGMVAVNFYAFAVSKVELRSLVQSPFSRSSPRLLGELPKATLLSCAGGGLVVGALARTTLGPSLLTACNVEVFDPIVRAIALVAVRGAGLDLLTTGFLLLVLISQGHPYSQWVAVRYMFFSAGCALLFAATAKAFVSSIDLAGAAVAMRVTLALLGVIITLTLASAITQGDSPPPMNRKATRAFGGPSGPRQTRASGKSPATSPPMSPSRMNGKSPRRALTRLED